MEENPVLRDQEEEPSLGKMDISRVVALMWKAGTLDPAPIIVKARPRNHVEIYCAPSTTGSMSLTLPVSGMIEDYFHKFEKRILSDALPNTTNYAASYEYLHQIPGRGSITFWSEIICFSFRAAHNCGYFLEGRPAILLFSYC